MLAFPPLTIATSAANSDEMYVPSGWERGPTSAFTLKPAPANIARVSLHFTGEIELDESYFGAKRVRGKRGRGAYGKTIVFGVTNETA